MFLSTNFRDSGIPVIRISNVQSGRIDLSDAVFHPQLAIGPEFIVRNGDALVAMSGATTGKVGVYCHPSPAYQNQRVGRFIPKDVRRTSKSYISHIVRSREFITRLTTFLEQGAQPNVSGKQIESLPFAFPPTFCEQEAIAEALSDADALIEALEQLLAKKRDIKQGAMQELLTGKKRLPGFSGEWRTLPIGTCFNISGGLSASRAQLSHDGHCYLHYGDIHGSSKSFIDVDAELQDIPRINVPLSAVSPSSLLGDGDVVFVDASEDVDGTSRHVVITNPRNIPFISGLHTIVAKPKSDDLEPLYCRYCFHTEAVKTQFRFFAVGTKVSGVSKTNIAKIEVAVPEPKEQLAIAEILIDMDAEITGIETKLSKARQVKQGMMQELLTGRIRLV